MYRDEIHFENYQKNKKYQKREVKLPKLSNFRSLFHFVYI